MTLSDPNVSMALNDDFVCGWTNIKGKVPYAGSSRVHTTENPAVWAYNCAGHHNVQIFFMTADGRVLHCLPGFWEPHAFLHELTFAKELAKTMSDESLPPALRRAMWIDAHLTHILHHDERIYRNSQMEHFDRADVLRRAAGRDFHREGTTARASSLKQPDQIVHERMSERVLLPFAEFDTAAFVDLGRKFFDSRNDGGVSESHAAKQAPAVEQTDVPVDEPVDEPVDDR